MSDIYQDLNKISDTDVWCSLIRAWNAISRLRELELAQFGITVEQLSILKITRLRGSSITAKELEYLTMRQQHSISTLINRMITSGLLSRKKEPNERRYKISVTSEGERICTEATNTSIDMVFSVLSEEEKRRFALYIHTIYNKARDLLLGVSYNIPFIRGSETDSRISAQQDTDNPVRTNYELWALMDITGFEIFRLRELELVKFGLTIEQSMVLAVIDHYGGSTTSKELEYFLVRQHHSISTLINRMMKRGLVVKEKPKNEKKHRISMTVEGQKVFDRITTDSLELTFAFLTKKKKADFYHLMISLYDEASDLLGMHQKQPEPQPVSLR